MNKFAGKIMWNQTIKVIGIAAQLVSYVTNVKRDKDHKETRCCEFNFFLFKWI